MFSVSIPPFQPADGGSAALNLTARPANVVFLDGSVQLLFFIDPPHHHRYHSPTRERPIDMWCSFTELDGSLQQPEKAEGVLHSGIYFGPSGKSPSETF